MPLGFQESILCVSGALLAGASVVFYRAKRTAPFKVRRCASHALSPSQRPRLSTAPQVCYFLAWPVLGTGTILALQPAIPPGNREVRCWGGPVARVPARVSRLISP